VSSGEILGALESADGPRRANGDPVADNDSCGGSGTGQSGGKRQENALPSERKAGVGREFAVRLDEPAIHPEHKGRLHLGTCLHRYAKRCIGLRDRDSETEPEDAVALDSRRGFLREVDSHEESLNAGLDLAGSSQKRSRGPELARRG